MPVRLSNDEFNRRREVITAEMEKRSLEALCVFSPAQVFYLTGFTFIATERPIGAIYRPGSDSVSLFVPLLEVEHAEAAHVDLIRTYSEYPGEQHPMKHLVQLLSTLELEGQRIGVDADGYSGGYGYEGPLLSELTSSEVVIAKDLIEQLMWIKSDEEIDLIRESCKWGDLAHRLLQQYSAAGLVETDISFRASHEASMQMLETLGPEYRSMRFASFPAHADFRGQIGAQSAIPHSITTNAALKAGDVLVTGAASEVGGYLSELERTMILGTPTEDQRRFFDLMLGIQDVALDSIRPGVRCSDVDRAVSGCYKQHNIVKHWRHHTGHGIGYGMHESPFLDLGDDTPIEPGIYVPGFAGFRHSDTVLVTDTGIEILTSYPRDLDSLVIPV